MQKILANSALSFCLLCALFLACGLPVRGQGNNSSHSAVAMGQDYKLTVSEIQKLYKQTTDGMSSTNITQNPATIMYSRGPLVPLSSLQLPAAMQNMLATGVPTQGVPLTDTAFKAQLMQTQQQLLSQISDPVRNIPRELAQQLATQTMLGNSAAQVATAQANSAINYAGQFLINFTVNEGNVWNRLRSNLFVPIAILLLVPGTILTQTKALMAAGNPVIEQANPFEGILRAVIALCFIPGSYLVVNYGIDFSNSISHTIQDAYRAQFGTDMYADAFLAEQRAFPSRQAAENQNVLSGLLNGATASGGNQVTGFGQLENNLIKNKTYTANGTQIATNGLVDEVLPANAVAARMAVFGTNMVVTSIWDLLCAFQLIYLHYLFLVGPIMAAIWVYPVKQLREAWPNWVAGTITLCFWSLFWNTVILLMALFKDADSTGTFVMTALNVLATGSVKYAFDFVGLVTEAGQEAAKTARNNQTNSGNAASPSSTNKETRIESKADGSALGGITQATGNSILNAAAPGVTGAISPGSRLMGGKDDFTKGLSLPPLVSSVAQNIFPSSAGPLGIIGAAGLAGKDGISLPPLAGVEAASAPAEKVGSSFAQDVMNMTEKTAVSQNFSAAESDVENLISAVYQGAKLAPAADSALEMSSMKAIEEDSIEDEQRANASASIKSDPKSVRSGTAAERNHGAERAAAAGAIFAAANFGSSAEVKNFMHNLAGAAQAQHSSGTRAIAANSVMHTETATLPGHRTFEAVGLPPSAQRGTTAGNASHNLFKESAPPLETSSKREFAMAPGSRELNFSSAPPLKMVGSTYNAVLPASALTLEKAAADDTISSNSVSASSVSANPLYREAAMDFNVARVDFQFEVEDNSASSQGRPKNLHELLKPAAFERPCHRCKSIQCRCTLPSAFTVGAWA